MGDVIPQLSNISPQISISAQYFIFISSGRSDHPIFQSFTRNLYKCPIFDIHFQWAMQLITRFSNISPQISMLNSVPDIWYPFLVGDVIHCPIFHYFPIIIHAQSIAQYLIFVFSVQHNSSLKLSIFHLHAESCAWYLIYIFLWAT